MSCGIGHRHGLDPTLLWLWRRPAATTLIRPLAWEPPYAAGAAQKMAKKKERDSGGRTARRQSKPGYKNMEEEGTDR